VEIGKITVQDYPRQKVHKMSLQKARHISKITEAK
jgi:hypothetical protein